MKTYTVPSWVYFHMQCQKLLLVAHGHSPLPLSERSGPLTKTLLSIDSVMTLS